MAFQFLRQPFGAAFPFALFLNDIPAFIVLLLLLV